MRRVRRRAIPVTVPDAPHPDEPREPPEPPPSLPAYFGGYALVFAVIAGLGVLLVLAARCLR